jgi:serine/threonine-protein kinase RsbW
MKTFEANGSKTFLKLDFSSCFKNIDAVIETVLNYLENEELKIDSFEINVVLRELLTNAIRHGNKCNESKKINFMLRIDGKKLQFFIKDQGPGFDPVKELNARSDILTPHGMGITILTSLGYHLEYDREEKYLVVTKKVVDKNNIIEGNNYEPE